jgi:hypothetical protein
MIPSQEINIYLEPVDMSDLCKHRQVNKDLDMK